MVPQISHRPRDQFLRPADRACVVGNSLRFAVVFMKLLTAFTAGLTIVIVLFALTYWLRSHPGGER